MLLGALALTAGTALAEPPGAGSAAHAGGKDETRLERRRAHREKLFRQWVNVLGRAEVQAELRLHAERTARLRRLRFVAETERKGPDQEKILARVSKLLEKENARHERAMQRLAGPAAAASGTQPGLPAPPVPLALPSGVALPPIPFPSALPSGVALPPIPGLSARPARVPPPVASGGKR